ncbi:TPR repeat-containing protein YrrB [Phycisphaerae bacterium RAS1]|nr:TPR repeat-containing protein YrrB [Phycisphaerae bacterium RAS1]
MPVSLRRLAALAALLPLLLTPGCILGREQARVHLNSGDSALADNRLDAALAEFREAIRLDPGFAEAHTKLGEAYIENGDLDKAEQALQTAVKLDPGNFRSVFKLGEVYRMLDKLTQAIRAYVIACELNPRDFEARFRLGGCYQQSGDLEQATETYKQALQLDPKNTYAWSNLGAVYDLRGNTYDAIKAYKQALECTRTPQPIVLVNLATVYINQERYASARKTLQIAIQTDPNLSMAHERMGFCYWCEKKLDDAAQSYLRAVMLDNRNADAFSGYGMVRMTQFLQEPDKAGFRDEAIEAWHKSLELDPNQPKLKTLIEKYRPKTERPRLEVDD